MECSNTPPSAMDLHRRDLFAFISPTPLPSFQFTSSAPNHARISPARPKRRLQPARRRNTPCAVTLTSNSNRDTPTNTAVAQTYFATCPRGLGDVLAAELLHAPLNAHILHVASSGVRFRARAIENNVRIGYEACLWLRTATRVLQELHSADIDPTYMGDAYQIARGVYEVVKGAVKWKEVLGDGTFSVISRVADVASANSGNPGRGRNMRRGREHMTRGAEPPGPHVLQTVTKNAICDQLRDTQARIPPPPVSHAEADVPLFVTLHNDEVCIYRDLSGSSLHKRGYRRNTVIHKSSLNECVAAGMLYMAGFDVSGDYDGSDMPTVVDPMCGSGTLLIEAALLRLRVAVGLYRGQFAFERFPDFEEGLYRDVINDAVSVQRKDDELGMSLIGGDINSGALHLARQTMSNIRLSDMIDLRRCDARDLPLPHAPTLTICNPPWGMRLEEAGSWEALGEYLRLNAGTEGSRAVLLCGDAGASRGLRMRAERKVPVRIGNVDTRVLTYQVLPKLAKGDDRRGKKSRSSPQTDRRRTDGDDSRRPKLEEWEMPVL